MGHKPGDSGSMHSSKDPAQGPIEGRMQSNSSSSRPLRSWSSSEKSGPMMEDSSDTRRFSVNGPASSSGSRKSHTPRSLPTWAEEDGDENADSPRGMHGRPAHMGRLASAMHSMHVRNPSHPYARHVQATAFARRAMDAGSSSSSSGSVPQQQHGSNSNSNSSSNSSSNGEGRHRRLRTPYSISIPSMVGSPLSFTQSFLASRTSMYAKHPPSSQMRAAHIDWDSLSMMDELSSWSANRAELPMWAAKNGPRPHVLAGSGMSLLPHQYVHVPGQAPYAGHVAQPSYPHWPPPHSAAPVPPHMQMGSYPAHAALLNGTGAAAAAGWDPQAVWDYACHHHPLLASFSVASAMRLSERWRWVLLCIVAVATLCVLVGIPIALAVLLGRESALAIAA